VDEVEVAAGGEGNKIIRFGKAAIATAAVLPVIIFIGFFNEVDDMINGRPGMCGGWMK
jgi:hypothetical protein